MSIPVPLVELRKASAERGDAAYLLTITADARPHAVHVPLRWEGETLAIDVGKRTARNGVAHPTVSLLYPAPSPGDYSLIVDGTAVVDSRADGGTLRITPTTAVFHRPAAARDPDAACGADCVPILPAPPARGR